MISLGKSKSCFTILIVAAVCLGIKTYYYDIGIESFMTEHKEGQHLSNNVISEPWATWGIDQSAMFFCNNDDMDFRHCGNRIMHHLPHTSSVSGLSSHTIVGCSKTSLDVIISHFSKPVVNSVKAVIASTPLCKRPLRFFVYSKGFFPLEEKLLLESIVKSTSLIEQSDDAVQIHFVFNMSNVGRCDHTYLYHISQNYNEEYDSSSLGGKGRGLAELNLFMKDTTAWHIHLDEHSNVLSMLSLNFNQDQNQFKHNLIDLKKVESQRNLDNSIENDNTSFSSPPYSGPSSLLAWCPREVGLENPKFELKDYKSEQCSRFGRCYESELTYKRATVKPLGDWLVHMGIVKNSSGIISLRTNSTLSTGSNSSIFFKVHSRRMLTQNMGEKEEYYHHYHHNHDHRRLLTRKQRRHKRHEKRKQVQRYKEEYPVGIHACLGGIFAASDRAIRFTPLHVYLRLLKEMSVGDSLEAGHFMERAWFLVFGVGNTDFHQQSQSVSINQHKEKQEEQKEQSIMLESMMNKKVNTTFNSKKVEHKNTIAIVLLLNTFTDFEDNKNCYHKLPDKLKTSHLKIKYLVSFKDRSPIDDNDIRLQKTSFDENVSSSFRSSSGSSSGVKIGS